jgi:aryl-alcohol dehydrogenase-like predicted oxidoreductase
MRYRPLGTTGIQISVLSFGAGPVSGLMTGAPFEEQCAVVARALDRGVNWFDTAASYGQGRSEENLGRVLDHLGAASQVHVATKVRLLAEDLADIKGSVRRSVHDSLVRLRLPRVALLQLHNSVTARRGDEPTSITPADVLGPGGVLEAFRELRDEGLIGHLGLTGIGQPDAMREVVRSGVFAAVQVPYHVLNPSAGREMPPTFAETNYGNLIRDCAAVGMGVLAIRVFAAGALLGSPPSAHTLKTPFFPLSLYERDRQRAARLGAALGDRMPLKELALRYALSHPDVASAIVGFGAPSHVDEAVEIADKGPLSAEELAGLEERLHEVWRI